MKILHLHPSMAGGGIEAIICALVNNLSYRHSVTLATIFSPKKTDVFEAKISSRVHRVNFGKVHPGFSIKEIFDIYHFIKRGNFDIVNVHGFFYYYALTILLLHKKVKFFYTVHSDAFMENTKWDKKILFLKKMFFEKKFIHPITISEESKKSFYSLYSVNSSLIHNGIELPLVNTIVNPIAQYKITPRTKIFIHAARITLAKNQIVLCRSFENLLKDGFDAVLLIVGSNQDNSIMTEINSFLSDRILYLGERNDIPTLFYHSDAMCLPSIWEGLPVTLLEALSVGCIPLCSPVGGIINVVRNNYNGLLSDDVSVYSYYNTLKRFMLLNSNELNLMKENCLNSFKNYDIKYVATKYESVYELNL